MLDVEGKGGLEADLTTIEGIQKAYTQGKLSREDALSNMNKINRRLLKKPTPEPPPQETAKAIFDEEEVIIDPNTGEIISERPYPLTEEPAAGVTTPAGVDEVMNLMLTKQVKNIKELQQRLGVSFAKTKELWEAAKEQGKLIKGKEGYYEAPEIPIGAQKSAGEAVLPTPFRKQLKEMFYTDEEIDKMSTDEAWNIVKTDAKFMQGDWIERFSPEGEGTFIGKEPPPVSTKPPGTVIVSASEIDYIKQLRKDGYKLVDINKDGDFVFGRMEPSDVEAPGFQSKYKGATDRALASDADFDEQGNYIFGKAEPDSVNEPVFKTKEGFTIDELEEAVEIRQAQVAELRAKAANEPGSVGPIHQALQQAEKGAKAAGIRLSVARKEAQAFKKSGLSDLLGEEGSRMAVSEEGLAGMGIPTTKEARRDMIEIFRGTISGQTPHVAGKELLQNAIDAASAIPKGGRVKIIMDEKAQQIVVIDNGPGLTRQEVEGPYLDLTSSGKRGGEQRTIGELGVGKIAYLTKGQKFEFQTVAREADGQLMKHSFVATPEEVLDMKVRIISEAVPEGTPTGTATRLFIGKDEQWYGLRDFTKSLEKHSQLNVPVEILEQNNGINVNRYGQTTYPIIVAPKTSAVGQFSAGGSRVLGETTSPGAKLKVSVPWDAMETETNQIDCILVSRGMFQGVHTVSIGPVKIRVPNKILVEIDPTVKGTDERYPLTTPTRENMKWSTQQKVQDIIQSKLIDEAAKTRNKELETIFHQIVPKKGQKFAMVDPSEKFTLEELDAIANNSEMIKIAHLAENFLRTIESELAGLIPGSKIYSTGFIFEESTRGMNVRNPNNHNEFTILLNPLGILGDNANPREAADAIVHAMVHEFTHILERSEGARFTSALYRVYSNIDLRSQYNVRTRFEKVLNERGTGGGFGIEVQDLLRKGEAAYRRPGRERMALIAEEGSQLPAPRRQEGTTPTGESTSGRTLRDFPLGKSIVVNAKQATPEVLKKLWEEGFRFDGESPSGGLRFTKSAEPSAGPILETEVGSQRPTKAAIRQQLGPIQDAQKASIVAEIANIPRGALTIADLSAPFRQGLPLVHKPEFWKAMVPMMKSWNTEDGFQAAQASIANRPLFKRRVDAFGKEIPSFADDAGLKLTDLTDLSSREEALMSTWVESGGMFEANKWMAEHGGKEVAEFYRNTLGKVARKSNRAYTAFLNNLRADVFESLVKDAGIMKVEGADPKRNLPLARALADFVNTATGRGKLSVDIPKRLQPLFGTTKKGAPVTELSLESSAVLLNSTIFAPRLIAARIRMLNPATYLMAPPQVRKEIVKSLLALTTFGSTVLGLAKMAGEATDTPVDVSFDSNSSDFLKAKIGDKVRLDPWGGFQQYAVLFSRLISGKVTSSTPGAFGEVKEYNLWNQKPGPYDPSHKDIMERFVRGKTNPIINFAWAIADFRREMSGKSMQFTTPNPFENSITQRFIPIFVQDIYQIAQESPELLPLLGPAAGLGMGVQVYDKPGNQFYSQEQ